MSCIEVPRPASGAAPPRWHTTWSILPNRRPTQASQSETIGISKIHCIIPGMSPSRRIDPASVAIQVFLPGYAVLATISCGEIRPEHSTRTDTLPLSPDSMRCPSGASVKSVEQPCAPDCPAEVSPAGHLLAAGQLLAANLAVLLPLHHDPTFAP